MEKKSVYIIVGIVLLVLAVAIAVSLSVGKSGAQHLGWMTGTNTPPVSTGNPGDGNGHGSGIVITPSTAPIDRANAVKDLMEERNAAFDEAINQR